MGFNLYLAGGDSVPVKLTKEDNCGILTTFADGTKRCDKFLQDKDCKIFMDSGAFGVAMSGKKVDIDQYIEYINRTPNVTVWAALDVIPRPLTSENVALAAQQTWENYNYMIHHVKDEYRDKIIPTYHYGEPIEYLHKIINGFDDFKPSYIAFGGRGGISTKDLCKFFDNTYFNEIAKSSNPNVKIHGFGITSFSMVEKYPWYSADSTTWLRTGINGMIHCRTLNRRLIVSDRTTGNLNSAFQLRKEVFEAVTEEIESRGYTLKQLSEDCKARNLWNCQYFRDWADNFVYKPQTKPKRKRLF